MERDMLAAEQFCTTMLKCLTFLYFYIYIYKKKN